MKNLLISSILILFSINNFTDLSKEEKNSLLRSLSKERYFVYQDILVNGELIWQGLGPSCSERYSYLETVLNQYQRPIKVLDLGASNGYFSFKIAQNYQSLCVMVDRSERLLDLCYLNNSLKNIVYLKQDINFNFLSCLSEYEKFDVIIVFNILHHLDSYKDIIDILLKMGDVVIIESPSMNDLRTKNKTNIPLIEKYLRFLMEKNNNAMIIGHTLRPIPGQFDYLETMTTDIDLVSKINYSDSYSNIFYFGKINNSKKQNLFFNKKAYDSLGGVYYKIDQ